MNIKALIKKCLIDDDAIETHPFAKEEYQGITIIRHNSNNKWFAAIIELNGELCINLKCPPDLIPVLKDQYSAIKPAWHMNKKHWCTVEVNKIPPEVLENLINISFNITASKRKRKISE